MFNEAANRGLRHLKWEYIRFPAKTPFYDVGSKEVRMNSIFSGSSIHATTVTAVANLELYLLLVVFKHDK